jgi:hypothetical protein
MRKVVTTGICMSLLWLSACASAQQIASQDDATCRSYGASPGSQAYFDCRVMRDAQRAQGNRAVAQALATGLQDAGRQMSQRTPQPSTMTRCTSQRVGNGVDTTCF